MEKRTPDEGPDPRRDPRPDPRWRRRSEARPAEILDAALTVFSEKGFAGATLEDVARQAGVSKGTLYLYFDSKTALFEAMALDIMGGHVLPKVDELARTGSAAFALRAIVGLLAERFHDRRIGALPKLIISESGRFPELARFWLTTVIGPMRRRLVALIERGIAGGEFRAVDPSETMKLVIAPFLMAALWQHTFEPLDDLASDIDSMARLHAEFLLAGLAAVPSPPKEQRP